MIYTDRYIRTGGEILTGAGIDEDVARAAPLDTKPETFAERIYTRMFSGITMSTANEKTARAIILDERLAQEALTVKTLTMKSNPRLACEVWDKRRALVTARDSKLGTLVTAAADRALLERRTEENRRAGTFRVADPRLRKTRRSLRDSAALSTGEPTHSPANVACDEAVHGCCRFT